MGKIRKILETELVGGTQSTDVYPVTSTKAVYDTNNKVLDDYIQHLKKTSTFAGIATPTTNPGTPDGPVFYIAGEGTYANFSNIVIEAGQLGILKWNGTWSKEVLEIGAGGGSGGNGSGSGVSLGTLLAQLNNENPFPTDNGQVLTYNGSNFIWKTPTSGSGVTLNPTMSAMNDQLDKTSYGTPQFLYWNGSKYTWKNESEISGGSGSIQVAQTPEYSGESESWVSATKLRFVGITGTKPTIRPNSDKGCVDVGIPTGGGSGSSGTTDYSLTFYKDGSAESWNGEKNFRIIFGNGLNVDWDTNHTYLTLSATGGSSTGGSVDLSSYLTKTEASTTYAAKSHTHSASNITDFTSTVKGIKVNNATKADKANELNSAVTLWGNNFYGSNNINGNIKMGSAGGGSIQLWMNNGNMLDRTNNILHIGNGLKQSSDGEINLDAYKTVIYTDDMSKHYDFKSNVFDVNSNQIHFGSETNGGKIYWDAANNAFKIEGNVYATGGITALGVSNNATTSNNVDFTFRSVTANTFNVMDSIQLSDALKLRRNGDDIILVNINSNVNPSLYLGDGQEYYIDANGIGYFSSLSCDILDVPGGGRNFRLVNINDRSFTIQFMYNGKTYQFTPSEGNLSIS